MFAGEQSGSGIGQPGLVQHLEVSARGRQALFDVRLGEDRTEVGAAHAVAAVAARARLIQGQVVGGQRRAERATGIAGGRLYPDMLEGPVAQHLAVGHAVECHAAGQAQVLHARLRAQCARHTQHGLFRDGLYRGRQVHVALGQRVFGLPRRRAEQVVERRAGHAQAGAIVEVTLVQVVGAIGLEVDQVVEDRLRILRFAVGGQPHHLVLARVDLEPEVIGERRVQQPE